MRPVVVFFICTGGLMKNFGSLLLIFFICLGLALPAGAHFGMVIPSDSMVMPADNRKLSLQLSFSHPFEGAGMPLERPAIFGVMAGGQNQELGETLMPITLMGHNAWQADYGIKRPGVYVFYMQPQPYWEPAEACYIIHYTKTVVAAFGDDEGWENEIGLKTEIVPLAKPFGLYAGNVFQGIVKLDGRAVPFAEVEVEYYNADGRAQAPTEYMITQTVRADANGVFTYAAPRAGWWGFAALNLADYKLEKDGQLQDVEIGAVLWVRFHDWQTSE
jgi:cobalt/nickel transport protein